MPRVRFDVTFVSAKGAFGSGNEGRANKKRRREAKRETKTKEMD